MPLTNYLSLSGKNPTAPTAALYDSAQARASLQATTKKKTGKYAGAKSKITTEHVGPSTR